MSKSLTERQRLLRNARMQRYRDKHRVKVRAASRLRYATNAEFYRNKRKKRVASTAYSVWYTKNAVKIRARVKKWQSENRDKVRASQRKSYRKNKEKIFARKRIYRRTSEKAKSYSRNYARIFRQRHSEKYRAKDRARNATDNRKLQQRRNGIEYRKTHSIELRLKRIKRREENPELVKSWKQRDYQKNKEAYKQRVRVRQAIQLGATVDKSQIVELVTFLKSSTDTKCAYCGCELFGRKIHIDHIIPLSRGGRHAVDNLCASCPECNLSKNNKTPDEWRAWKKEMEGAF